MALFLLFKPLKSVNKQNKKLKTKHKNRYFSYLNFKKHFEWTIVSSRHLWYLILQFSIRNRDPKHNTTIILSPYIAPITQINSL